MTEAFIPAPDVLQYACGRCGYSFKTISREEYSKLYGEHTGPACLAVLGRLDADQVRYLINDIDRLMDRDNTVQQLADVLEMLAAHKDTL